MSNSSFNLKEIPIFPRSTYGKWYRKGVRNQGQSIECDIDMFLSLLKSSHIAFDRTLKQFGPTHKATSKAKAVMNFYLRQIDDSRSDVLLLSMSDPQDWNL